MARQKDGRTLLFRKRILKKEIEEKKGLKRNK